MTLLIDACNTINILNDTWRTINSVGDNNDANLKEGWYRLFLNGISANMVTYALNYYNCGAWAPLWWKGMLHYH